MVFMLPTVLCDMLRLCAQCCVCSFAAVALPAETTSLSYMLLMISIQDFDSRAGASRRSNVNALTEQDLLNAVGKRKGKGGRQPAMDPRLDPNVDPKRAKRILANRLSAARSKMKQKSHVEVCWSALCMTSCPQQCATVTCLLLMSMSPCLCLTAHKCSKWQIC